MCLLACHAMRSKMVSKELFAGSFWHCYNTLQAAATEEVGMPGYFRFLTLLGEKVSFPLLLTLPVLHAIGHHQHNAVGHAMTTCTCWVV
jgi:hypothetical protein